MSSIQTSAERCYENHKRGSREYYARNKAAISLRLKNWYQENKESQTEYKRKYYLRRKAVKELEKNDKEKIEISFEIQDDVKKISVSI